MPSLVQDSRVGTRAIVAGVHRNAAAVASEALTSYNDRSSSLRVCWASRVGKSLRERLDLL